MSLLEKLKKEIAMDPMDLIARKIEVKCQCNQVSHNRNPMFSEMQTVRDMSHTWKGDKDKEWEVYQANKD